MGRKWRESEIKCILIQLLKAVAHLHKNFIIHRDLKLSNLLMNNKGILKLADFGLARIFGNPLQAYTPKVITLWYRAPEILLGVDKYHTAVDMWALGCIFGELVKHKPILPGNSETEQLDLIFKLLGTPNSRIAPIHEWQLFESYKSKLHHYKYNELQNEFAELSPSGIDLLTRLLTYDPAKRITAEQALQHVYFYESPLPQDPAMMPTFPDQSKSLTESRAMIRTRRAGRADAVSRNRVSTSALSRTTLGVSAGTKHARTGSPEHVAKAGISSIHSSRTSSTLVQKKRKF
jgi:serine/threonine protein kinase